MIKFKDAHIGYNLPLVNIDQVILDSGNVYILAGKNGVGKSTLLKTLTLQVPLKSGEVMIMDKSLQDLTPKDLSKYVAFVHSRFPDTHFITVYEFVALGRTPYTNAFGRLTQEDRMAVEEALKDLHIIHLKDKFVNQVSDGERQLVSIARAFAQDTPIILLDEPTAYLDYQNKKRVLKILTENASRLNKCILMSSHDLELSIDAGIPFVVINATSKTITLHKAPVNKQRIIDEAFSPQ